MIVENGFEQVTMRGLARELGVSPMALYRHVANKDDLLDEVVDGLLRDTWRPRADDADWRSWIMEAADRLRVLLVDQPAALHVFLRHPVVSPAALDRMDAVVRVLRQVLSDEERVTEAYAAIQTYTIGFAALEASRGMRGDVDVDAASSEMVDRLAGFASPRQFTIGLGYLLDGIES